MRRWRYQLGLVFGDNTKRKGDNSDRSSTASELAGGGISPTVLLSDPLGDWRRDAALLPQCCVLPIFETIFGQVVLSQKCCCICVSNNSDCIALLLGLLHRNDA